ncbi:serine hydrolase [Streptomyces sp. ODS28]|uniref:D-alanyl-D-alanine carboxypeptidase family protein n=1 Tax=Streptomyces sp. ODS28 TaxID=3136688 RepID=UPI0031EA897F
MGAHARPKKSRNTGLMMSTAAVVGMAAPVAVSGVASAAPATHSPDGAAQEISGAADSQAPGSQTADAAQQSSGKHAAPGGTAKEKDLATSGWGKSGKHAAPKNATTEAPATKAAATTAKTASAPKVHTQYAHLADAKDAASGTSLWAGSKGDTAVPMGSITKVMTAEVVAKHHAADLDKLVTVKQEYRDYVQKNGASTADLKTGDKLTVRQLLDAMLIPSGCDAAYALADTLGEGGTSKERVADFVGQMNKEAQALGMDNTRFDTPSGISLDNGNHSTASDLTKLGASVLQDKTLAQVVKQQHGHQVATNGRDYTWDNTDKLLKQYNGALGIKTGSGPDDGYCLLFAAERDGRTLVGSVLQDTEARFDDAAAMLDWGFQQGA